MHEGWQAAPTPRMPLNVPTPPWIHSDAAKAMPDAELFGRFEEHMQALLLSQRMQVEGVLDRMQEQMDQQKAALSRQTKDVLGIEARVDRLDIHINSAPPACRQAMEEPGCGAGADARLLGLQGDVDAVQSTLASLSAGFRADFEQQRATVSAQEAALMDFRMELMRANADLSCVSEVRAEMDTIRQVAQGATRASDQVQNVHQAMIESVSDVTRMMQDVYVSVAASEDKMRQEMSDVRGGMQGELAENCNEILSALELSGRHLAQSVLEERDQRTQAFQALQGTAEELRDSIESLEQRCSTIADQSPCARSVVAPSAMGETVGDEVDSLRNVVESLHYGLSSIQEDMRALETSVKCSDAANSEGAQKAQHQLDGFAAALQEQRCHCEQAQKQADDLAQALVEGLEQADKRHLDIRSTCADLTAAIGEKADKGDMDHMETSRQCGEDIQETQRQIGELAGCVNSQAAQLQQAQQQLDDLALAANAQGHISRQLSELREAQAALTTDFLDFAKRTEELAMRAAPAAPAPASAEDNIDAGGRAEVAALTQRFHAHRAALDSLQATCNSISSKVEACEAAVATGQQQERAQGHTLEIHEVGLASLKESVVKVGRQFEERAAEIQTEEFHKETAQATEHANHTLRLMVERLQQVVESMGEDVRRLKYSRMGPSFAIELDKGEASRDNLSSCDVTFAHSVLEQMKEAPAKTDTSAEESATDAAQSIDDDLRGDPKCLRSPCDGLGSDGASVSTEIVEPLEKQVGVQAEQRPAPTWRASAPGFVGEATGAPPPSTSGLSTDLKNNLRSLIEKVNEALVQSGGEALTPQANSFLGNPATPARLPANPATPPTVPPESIVHRRMSMGQPATAQAFSRMVSSPTRLRSVCVPVSAGQVKITATQVTRRGSMAVSPRRTPPSSAVSVNPVVQTAAGPVAKQLSAVPPATESPATVNVAAFSVSTVAPPQAPAVAAAAAEQQQQQSLNTARDESDRARSNSPRRHRSEATLGLAAKKAASGIASVVMAAAMVGSPQGMVVQSPTTAQPRHVIGIGGAASPGGTPCGTPLLTGRVLSAPHSVSCKVAAAASHGVIAPAVGASAAVRPIVRSPSSRAMAAAAVRPTIGGIRSLGGAAASAGEQHVHQLAKEYTL